MKVVACDLTKERFYARTVSFIYVNILIEQLWIRFMPILEESVEVQGEYFSARDDICHRDYTRLYVGQTRR